MTIAMLCARSRLTTKALVGGLTVLAGVAVRAPAATAQSSFYEGKTVTIVVSYAPGGGYDFYSRLLSRHIGNHIPGKPTVIVQNMPGAAGIVATNHVYAAAVKDAP